MRRIWPSPVAALLAISLTACGERRHPWEQGDAAAPPPSPRASSSSASLLPRPTGDVEPGAAAAPDDGPGALPPAEEDAGAPALPVRVGGPWVRCYGNFHVSGDPLKDVTRLALLCGPENGMRRLSKRPLEGSVSEGAPPVTETFEARRGECYRVFAVAEPAVGDLDVTLRSSRGAAIAADHGEDAWPIVQPDRPLCPLEDDRVSVEVSARRGQGRFALEVWVLRNPPPKAERRFALPDNAE